MHLVYLDESGSFNDGSFYQGSTLWQPTDSRQSTHFVLSAIIVDTDHWKDIFSSFKKLRQNIKRVYGIPLSECLHANELIAGKEKWQHITRKSFDRPKRVRLFKMMLHEYGQWRSFRTISAVVDKSASHFSSINPKTCRQLAYENLLSRVEKATGTKFLIIHDGVEDLGVIRIVRRMQVIHQIGGSNKPLKNIIEDPLFKRNTHSYFLQATDHLAYAILHCYDTRFNKDVSESFQNSQIQTRLGVAEACRATSDTSPGIIPIPTPRQS